MRFLWRTVKILLSVVGLVLVAIFLYRAHVQHHAKAIAIHTPNSIDEGVYVKIGGIDQWIQIRGQDRNNPVLLCLHGGPGATWLPLTALFVPWEKQFTVVQWDQRGAGKTLEATGDSVANTVVVERMTQDGIEASEFLRIHLRKDKIILLGHSFGSILGIHMLRERPDLFSAYVGTGQVSDMQRSLQLGYAYCLEKARAAGDKKAIQELEDIGPPPYGSPDKVIVHFNWLGRYQVESDRSALSLVGKLMFGGPNFSLRDIYNRNKGFAQIPTWRLYQEMLNANLLSLGADFSVPIYFFQGAVDEVTPAPLAREYFGKISAPYKEFVAFEGCRPFRRLEHARQVPTGATRPRPPALNAAKA